MTDIEKEAIAQLTLTEDVLFARLTEIMRGIETDGRWHAIAVTQIELGFMAARRAVRDGKRTDE